MRWLLKVGAFKVLGALPGGEAIYQFLQQEVTHSIAVTDGRVSQKIQVGVEYLDFVDRVFNVQDFNGITHVDIGAGWMPTIPLLFYSMGFERQLLCDIRRYMRLGVVSDVIRSFRQVVSRERMLATHCKRMPPLIGPGDTLDAYFTGLGIRYIAPYTINDLLQDKHPKLITCTQVLMHLNKDHLSALLRTIASLLKHGGIFITTVHLYDIWSDFDKTLSRYHKWEYSDFVWENLFNSKMMSFNRLTASEYKKLFEGNGLEIVEFRVDEPTAADLEELRSIKVHKQFSQVPQRELAARELFLVAKCGGSDVGFPGLSQSTRKW
jgi:SAM-dependent methyltransferase